MNPLVLATHNEGKVVELQQLLKSLHVKVISAGSLSLPEPVEDGETFADNAIIKSKSAATRSGHWALADDSGLCVTALHGEPGVLSARWGGPKKDFVLAMERVHTALVEKGASPQGAEAEFVCVLSLTTPDGTSKTFEGKVHGSLTFPLRGEKGFGYDPIFIPDGYSRTFAEMKPEEKYALSHRTRAFDKFLAYAQTLEGKKAI
jgi:XTP/dITP diphosphohydrolase